MSDYNQKNSSLSSALDIFSYNFLYIFLAISILVFIFWPVVEVIIESFYFDESFSLEMYRNLFQRNFNLVTNSLFVAVLTTTLTIIFSTFVAIYTSFAGAKLKRFIFLVLLMTMVSPPFVSALAYIRLFGRRGFMTYGLFGVTLNTYGWQGIVAMQTLSNISLSALIIIGVISGIDKSYIMAAKDLGADTKEIVFKIIIPLAKPGIIVVALLSFVRSLADFGTPIIIGGGYRVLATQIYLNVIAYFNLPRAAAMSVLILIPAMFAFFVYRYYMENLKFSSSGFSVSDRFQNIFKLSGAVKYLITVFSCFFLTAILLQYFTILFTAVTTYSGGNLIFTLDHLRALDSTIMASFYRSIRYSLIAASAGSFIGLLLSYYIERSNLPGIKSIDLISTLPYIIPGTFFGIGYILAFRDYPLRLTGTAAIVLLNYIYRQMPLVIKTGSAVLQNVSQDLERAAKDLGAGRLTVIKDIVFPSLKPAFLVSFVNTFAVTMTSIGAVIFLIYPGGKVATVEMFDAIENGNYGLGAVMASMILLFTLIVSLTFVIFIMPDKKITESDKFKFIRGIFK